MSLNLLGLQEKVALHQRGQQLTLELECAKQKQAGFSDQVAALHSELVAAKTRVNHQDQEKVRMEKELESTRQVILLAGHASCPCPSPPPPQGLEPRPDECKSVLYH